MYIKYLHFIGISLLTAVLLVACAQPNKPAPNLDITLSQYMEMDRHAQNEFLNAATKRYAKEISELNAERAKCIATLSDTDQAAINHIMTVLERNSKMYPSYPAMNVVERTSDNLCE